MRNVYFVIFMLYISFPTCAENHFNPAFFGEDVADLSRFEENKQTSGYYNVELYVNNKMFKVIDILFKEDDHDLYAYGLYPCISSGLLSEMGVDLDTISYPKGESCIDIKEVIKNSDFDFDFDKLKLSISIPQINLHTSPQGEINDADFKRGINALTLSYDFTGSNGKEENLGVMNSNESYFLSLNSGLYIGDWSLKNTSSLYYNDDMNKFELENIKSYIFKPITKIKSNLMLGDTYTNSEIFDNFGMRGAILTSDDSILPDSMRGFAPTIRGIANSNAKITIKQHGYIIYENYVPAGEFEISDLYSTSSSGDLLVQIEESDGSIRKYNVPYSSVPLLQREGKVKYSASIGKYRTNRNDQNEDEFIQTSGLWGMPGGLTLYSGFQLAKKYQSIALGSGYSLGSYGAFSIDLTQAFSTLADDSHHSGQSIRFLYAKSLNDFGTNIQLMGYRYSTKGYYSFEDTTYKKMNGYYVDGQDGSSWVEPDITDYYNLHYNKRGRLQVNISQQIGEHSSFYITGSSQTYWNTDEAESLFQLGFSSFVGGVSVGSSYSFNKSPWTDEYESIFSLNVSIPLDISYDLDDLHANSNYSYTSDSGGNTTQTIGIGGNLLKEEQLSYNFQENIRNNGGGHSGNMSFNYSGQYGKSNLSYSYGRGSDYKRQRLNYGLSGGLIIHDKGVTLGQSLGDTNALVMVNETEGASFENQHGIKTDKKGLAIIPYLTPYRENRIALNTNSLPENTEVENAVDYLVPVKGTVNKVEFKSKIGARVIFKLTVNGKPLPFGASANINNENYSIVGDDGEVYFSGVSSNGEILVEWGDKKSQSCKFYYKLSKNALDKSINRISGECT